MPKKTWSGQGVLESTKLLCVPPKRLAAAVAVLQVEPLVFVTLVEALLSMPSVQ